MARQLHLNVNILNAGVFGGSWRFPGTDPVGSFTAEHYTSIARRAEAAKLDAVFLADGPVLAPDLTYRPGNNLEPTTVLAAIAAQTGHVGLIGTLSSSYNDPRELARRVLDLDRISGGRAGWNVVTTAGAAAAQNFGRSTEPEHASRYRRAAEFVNQVKAEWDSRGGPPSPQGRPVIVQAGGSSDGRRLASRVGEVIFSADQTLAGARDFRAEIWGGAADFGRAPEEIVVLPGLSTVIGSTEREAWARRELLSDILPDPYARRRLSSQLGFSVDDLDPDRPIPAERLVEPDTAGSSQTFYRQVIGIIEREKPTLRQLLRRLGGGAGHRIVVGTPEQIADDI
ncbi:MAG: LLM class flavin-dependent oxidoreductase, partial [Actinobacteria bacterium]|nr:LLM class flavin-dependent oxidoreductase [Actinomycetota bacterium]